MKTGDEVRDAQGRSYQVGPLLGRGVWGKSYLVRCEDEEYVLRCPLTRDDFRGDTPAPVELLNACRDATLELGRLLEAGSHSFLPPLHARFTTADGTPVLVRPRYPATLKQRLEQGAPLSEVLETLSGVLKALRELESFGPHGALRPSNVLLSERGQVFLTDPVPPGLRASFGRLAALAPHDEAWLPPEQRRDGQPLDGSTDTWALALVLHQACTSPTSTEGGRPHPLPSEGLDKTDLVEVRKLLEERLGTEDANPRFHGRLADRASALLNRGLSRESQPSPPYRFRKADDLLPRIDELLALLRPAVDTVGKVLLNRPPGVDAFETGEEVVFTVSIGTSVGIDAHDEISCGIAVFDARKNERLRNVPCAYTVDRLPSGRFRFLFKLAELVPGAYKVRVAFAVRDSGHPPTTTEARFQVRAAPGYVPPRAEEEPAVLPLERRTDTAVTEVGAIDSAPVAPVAPVAPDVPVEPAADDDLPRPISPPEPAPPPSMPPLGVAPAAPVPLPGPAAFDLPSPDPAPAPVPAPAPAPAPTPSVSWVDQPLPGAQVSDDPFPDRLDEADDWRQPGPVERFVDLVKSDMYLAVMAGLAAFIVVLLIVLTLN